MCPYLPNEIWYMILTHNDVIDNWVSIRGTCRHLKEVVETHFTNCEKKRLLRIALRFTDWTNIQCKFEFSHVSPDEPAVAIFTLLPDEHTGIQQKLHRLARFADEIRHYDERKFNIWELQMHYGYGIAHEYQFSYGHTLCMSWASPLSRFQVDTHKKELELNWMQMVLRILVHCRWTKRLLEDSA